MADGWVYCLALLQVLPHPETPVLHGNQAHMSLLQQLEQAEWLSPVMDLLPAYTMPHQSGTGENDLAAVQAGPLPGLLPTCPDEMLESQNPDATSLFSEAGLCPVQPTGSCSLGETEVHHPMHEVTYANSAPAQLMENRASTISGEDAKRRRIQEGLQRAVKLMVMAAALSGARQKQGMAQLMYDLVQQRGAALS
jgi:hypothetical protein